MRHGFLERSKEGAPGICVGLRIEVVAKLMRTSIVKLLLSARKLIEEF